VLHRRARPHVEALPDFACRRRIGFPDGNNAPQFVQVGLSHAKAFPKFSWIQIGARRLKKWARSAERQGQQARTEQEKAGDGNRKKRIGGKFVAHLFSFHESAIKHLAVLAKLHLRISATRARRYSRFEHAEKYPHDRTPLFDRGA